MNKQKKYVDNNLYMYCSDKSHRVEVCSLYPSKTTIFQVRHAETALYILKTTPATQSEN